MTHTKQSPEYPGRFTPAEDLVLYSTWDALLLLAKDTGLIPVRVDDTIYSVVTDTTNYGSKDMNKRQNIFGAFIAALFTVGTPTGVSAQEAGAGALEEIIVTATRRSVSIQDVAISITALSQQTLDRAGIQTLEEFAWLVPGLAISGQSNGRAQLNIRGVSSGEIRRDNSRATETVGIYFDEVPLSIALYNPNMEPFDLERVEVLRGPQGTLYGSGSLAGTIRLVSRAPEMNEFEGLIDAGINSVGDGGTGYSLKGVLNMPISEDTLAARVTVYQIDEAGWIDNLSDGPGGGEDVNSSSRWGVRAALLWTPTEPLSIKATYMHQAADTDGTPADNIEALGVQRLINVGTLRPDQAFDPSGKYEQWKYHDQFYDDEIDIFNLHALYDFDSSQLSSSTSYTNRDIRVLADISLNNLAAGFFPAPPPPTGGSVNVLGITLDDNKSVSSFAQEFRLTSTGDSDFQWIAGLFYSEIEVDYFQDLTVTDPRGITGVPPNPLVIALYAPFGNQPGVLVRIEDDYTTKQGAVFGEVNYRFADKWQATVGARYFDVDQLINQGKSGRLTGDRESFTLTKNPTEDGINPKFILSYEPSDDILISAQAARGFRLGGPQSFIAPVAVSPTNDCPGDIAALGANIDPDGFDSESLWNYELGLKSVWADSTVVFNAAAFFIDYQDLQVTSRLDCGTSFTTNAEGAETKGIEFEMQYLATDDLSFSFGGSYVDTELTADLPSGEAVAGDELIYVPKLGFNASMQYTRPLSDARNAYMYLSYQYTGSVDMFYPAQGSVPVVRSPEADAYETVNLRIGVEAEKWEMALYVNNLFDEYGTTYIDSINANGPGGWVTDTTIRPRTIGLNAKYRF